MSCFHPYSALLRSPDGSIRAAGSHTSSSSLTWGPHQPELLALVDQAHVSAASPQPGTAGVSWDAVLRLAATEFIDRHADLAVGACSSLQARLVSDRWLADVGAALGIEQHLLLGRHAQETVPPNPDCEPMPQALIGALYSALGNVEAIHRWLTPHWCATVRRCWRPTSVRRQTALQEWSQGQGLGLPRSPPRMQPPARRPERFRCR